MTIKEMIAVMQAFVNGKKIEYRLRDDIKSTWRNTSCPCWNWKAFEYRIKPEEEKPALMTNRQLAEWVGKGNGEWSAVMLGGTRSDFGYIKGKEDLEVNSDFLIRPWGSDEWVEPTVDIYERDCKGVK